MRLMTTTKKQAATFAARFSTEIAPPFLTAAKRALRKTGRSSTPRARARVRVLDANDTHRLCPRKPQAHGLRRPGLERPVRDTQAETRGGARPRGGRRAGPRREAAAGSEPAQGVRDLASGVINRETFLERFGHRGTNEMEFVATARGVKRPIELRRLVAAGKGQCTSSLRMETDSAKVADEAKLGGPQRDQFQQQVERLRTYLGLREAGKHYLLMGYAVIRRALVELDRRFGLNGGIFFLTPADLGDLISGRISPVQSRQPESAGRRNSHSKYHQSSLATIWMRSAGRFRNPRAATGSQVCRSRREYAKARPWC